MTPYAEAVEGFARPLLLNRPDASWVVSEFPDRAGVVSLCVGLPDNKRVLELFRGRVELDDDEMQRIKAFIKEV